MPQASPPESESEGLSGHDIPRVREEPQARRSVLNLKAPAACQWTRRCGVRVATSILVLTWTEPGTGSATSSPESRKSAGSLAPSVRRAAAGAPSGGPPSLTQCRNRGRARPRRCVTEWNDIPRCASVWTRSSQWRANAQSGLPVDSRVRVRVGGVATSPHDGAATAAGLGHLHRGPDGALAAQEPQIGWHLRRATDPGPNQTVRH